MTPVLCLKIRVTTRTCPAWRSSVSRQATYRPTFRRTSSNPSYGNPFPRWELMLNILLARYASMRSVNGFSWFYFVACQRDAGVKSASCQPNQQSAIPNSLCVQPSEMQSAYDCEFEQLNICTKKVGGFSIHYHALLGCLLYTATVSMSTLFRLAFPFDDCTFPKFHMSCHYPWIILRYGNVRDSNTSAGARPKEYVVASMYSNRKILHAQPALQARHSTKTVSSL